MTEEISSLNIEEILQRNIDESSRLEYKDVRADKQNIAEELTALANTDGGRILYGVQENEGEIMELQDVSDLSELEEGISQVLVARTDPTVSVDIERIDYEGSTVAEYTVKHQGVLHTYRPSNNKPYIPIRVGTTTDFLSGSAIREFYRSYLENQDGDTSISEWLDEIRKKAHRVTYTFKKSDFGEVEDRVSFTLTVKNVVEGLEDRLAEPDQDIEDDTKKRIEGLVITGQALLDCQTRVSRTGVYSLGSRPVEREYTEDSPDEVKRKYREAADGVRESAISLRQHLI